MRMFSHRPVSVCLLFIGALAILPSAAVAKSSDKSSIKSFSRAQRPWNIDRSGRYELRRNLTVRRGDAIVITASNVTLDLNGYEVSTRARGSGRGIVIDSAKAVTVLNGKVSGFNVNVVLDGAENARVSNLQITGDGLAPDGGPSEIGILLINSRACTVGSNNISSVNLGVFVRGGGSTGNRIENNVIVGGATDSSNLLGICYNPAPGGVGPEGPSGDSVYNNHIARFNYAISVSEQSLSNIFTENTLSSFTGPFRDPEAFEDQGGTNAEFDNTSTILAP